MTRDDVQFIFAATIIVVGVLLSIALCLIALWALLVLA